MSRIFNEKKQTQTIVLKESSHGETIFKQNLLTEGSDRSWPRGLRLNMELAALEGAAVMTSSIYTVSKKRHPFYFCENLAKYFPISVIFGSSIPNKICNKSMHVYPPHLFTVLIPYPVKIMIHLITCIYMF